MIEPGTNFVGLIKSIAKTTGYNAQQLAQELKIESTDLFKVLANVQPDNQPSEQTAQKIINLYHKVHPQKQTQQ